MTNFETIAYLMGFVFGFYFEKIVTSVCLKVEKIVREKKLKKELNENE